MCGASVEPPPSGSYINLRFPRSDTTYSTISVLDLDKTLWIFYSGFENAPDSRKDALYPDTVPMIQDLRKKGYLAIASLSPDPLYALSCIDRFFGIQTFDQIMIYGLYNREFTRKQKKN